MTRKQRGPFTVVLLLLINIEYTLSDFFPLHLFTDMFLSFVCVYPSQAASQQ